MARRFISEELDLALRSDLLDDDDVDEGEGADLWWHRRTSTPEPGWDRARWNLARWLGLRRVEYDLDGVLDSVLVALEAVMLSPSQRVDRGTARAMAERAVRDLNVYALLAILKAKRWDDASLPQGCKVKNLVKHLRPMVIERLAEELRSILEKWREMGNLDLKNRHGSPEAPRPPRTPRGRLTGKERDVRLGGTFAPPYRP